MAVPAVVAKPEVVTGLAAVSAVSVVPVSTVLPAAAVRAVVTRLAVASAVTVVPVVSVVAALSDATVPAARAPVTVWLFRQVAYFDELTIWAGRPFGQIDHLDGACGPVQFNNRYWAGG